jgi:hypothetical protein
MIAAFMLLAAQSSPSGCDLAAIKTARALHEGLAHRAVEIVAAASATSSAANARLQRFVDQSARFSLGAGDVGRPLGMGTIGARSLAVTMKADQYRFLGWDFMDGPADACGKQTIRGEFVNSIDRLVSQVEFTFDRGQVIAAKGWQQTFESGTLPTTATANGG